MKGTIIFSDQGKEEQKKQILPQDSVSLSRQEYRQLIKDAYKEGMEDALKERENEKKEATNNKQTSNDVKKVEEAGKKEAIKQHAKEKEQNMQRFRTITDRQDIELFRANSVFPYSLFTDTIIIDTTKVTISKRELFATEYVSTIPLKDLSDVNIQTYLFLGTLEILYMPHSDSPGTTSPIKVKISNLKREDAVRAKNILKGALVAKAEEIDIAALSPQEIEEVLHKFGQSEGVI